MAIQNNAQVRSYLTDLENLWQGLDEMLGSLNGADWNRKHGPDWVMADVPYHLAYFDNDVVAINVDKGKALPASQQWAIRSPKEIDDWNARKFGERTRGQTPERSLAQMRASRNYISGLVGAMSDADLGRECWMPLLVGGWMPAAGILHGCQFHTWNHAMELRLHLEGKGPVPSDSATHRAMGTGISFLSMFLDRQAAANTQFTAVLEITGPGGGSWALKVVEGDCQVAEERPAKSDVVLNQSAETFMKMWIGMLNPATAMQTGELKVDNMANLPTFGSLFPRPTST
ncbi:MAG: SCP2 sterol-binding domain-containing protein [Chloroflexi bacterium]|nr:SCP2 sterol-binding domain-containing protein [Chloroflexota bacterium]